MTTVWFRLPSEAAPALTAPELGMRRLVARTADSFRTRVEVFDSEDARLLRAGIVVGLRSRDDERAWYVSAPSWPGLPDEGRWPAQTQRDLPEDIRHKLQLFLRHAPLTGHATVEFERRAWTLAVEHGTVAITDDRVEVFRGETGVPTRELAVAGLDDCTQEQRQHLLDAISAAGAAEVGPPPSLPERLGVPVGVGALVGGTEVSATSTLEDFVCATMRGHLRSLLVHELQGDVEAAAEETARIRRSLQGLASVLQPTWREELDTDLVAARGQLVEDRDAAMLRVIDALVAATRAPQLGDHGMEGAAPVLLDRAEHLVGILRERGWSLGPLSGRDDWVAALRSARQLDAVLGPLVALLGKPARKFRRVVDEALEVLERSVQLPDDIELVGLTVEEAFQLGRDVEHARWTAASARQEFQTCWAGWAKRGRKAMEKMWRAVA